MSAVASTPRSRPIRAGGLEVALFAIGLLLAGLVTLALLWSGPGPYADLARQNGVTSVRFVSHGPGGDVEYPLSLDQLVEQHRIWSAYVTGGATPAPTSVGRSPWTDQEYAHMRDVRGVFQTAKLMVPVGFFVMAVRLVRARAAGASAALRLVRDGSLLAAGLLALVGAIATLAFDPLFLLFHEVFFPQGNYLFDPATSNLVRLYPDWYWEGISLRIGLSFIGISLVAALASAIALRRVK